MNLILTNDIRDSSSIVELLSRRALAHPHRVMCTYSPEGTAPRLTWTYADVDARASASAVGCNRKTCMAAP